MYDGYLLACTYIDVLTFPCSCIFVILAGNA